MSGRGKGWRGAEARVRRRKILRLYRAGLVPSEIARRLHVKRGTVVRHLKATGVPLTHVARVAPTWGSRRPPYWELHAHGGAVEVVLGRKFCPGCGRWRLLLDYPVRLGRPAPRCRACQNIEHAWRYAHQTEAQREIRNEYRRFQSEVYRRRAGAEPREFKNRHTVIDRPEYVFLSREPLLGELERLNGDVGIVARRAGVPERTLLRIRTGESRRVRIDVADKLAVALGIPLEALYNGEGVRGTRAR